jgi:hypothetical protein
MIISRWILLIMRNVSDKCRTENKNTHFMSNSFFFPENRTVYEICGKIWYSQRGHRWQYNTVHAHCMLDYPRLQTHTQNMEYLLLFNGNYAYTKASQCSVMYALLVLPINSPLSKTVCIWSKFVGRDSVVGIATRYELDGPAIESRWGRDFQHPSRPALRPNQPPVQWVPGHSRV